MLWIGRIKGTIWCIYVQTQNRYMHPVVNQTMIKLSFTASAFEIFLVSFANKAGTRTDAITPRIPNTTVPVMMPGAKNPYDCIDMVVLGEKWKFKKKNHFKLNFFRHNYITTYLW